MRIERLLLSTYEVENNPNHKPSIFAIYTTKYAYGHFNLKELISYLQFKTPF